VQQLREEILDAEEYLGQLKAAVTAMVHKRDSIENETRLVLSKANTILGSCDADTADHDSSCPLSISFCPPDSKAELKPALKR
jgi:hypothetical protein